MDENTLICAFSSGALCSLISYIIGSNKGKGLTGFFLGLLLGPIGLLITLIMSPSEEIQQERDMQRINQNEATTRARIEQEERIRAEVRARIEAEEQAKRGQ